MPEIGRLTASASLARAARDAGRPRRPGHYADVGGASISFCTTSRPPAPQVRALLKLIRPYVDEIVLAVDRRGDPDTLAACADLADQRWSFEISDSPSRLAGWLTNLCRCDWILRLDDDEVPGAELLGRLGALTADRRVINYVLPRRWLYPDGHHYIDSGPWIHEPQMRLFRNLPPLRSFSGLVHDEGTYMGGSRWVQLPFYHCDLVLTRSAERHRKAAVYEALRPGLRIEGVSTNDLYRPENWSGLRTCAVPPSDLPLVRRMLDPAPAPPRAGGVPIQHSTPWEVDRFNDLRPVSEDLYQARVVIAAGADGVPAGATRHWQVTVTNLGGEPWPPGESREPRIRVGCRWVEAASGAVVPEEQARAYFSETVLPGESTRLFVGARSPARPNEYLLEVDVVHEDVRWFGCGARQRVNVFAPDDPDTALEPMPTVGSAPRLQP